MSRIGVICAFNPHNYGMFSVDLAARRFFRSLGQPFTTLVTQERRLTSRLHFERVRDPQQLGRFDALVYWGDFLNNPMWGHTDYCEREIAHLGARDHAQAWQRWLDLYLRVKQRFPALRVYAFGGCFLGADDPKLVDAKATLKEFLSTAELVAPRDSRSFDIVTGIAPDAHIVRGMDNAWLLPFAPEPPPAKPRHFVHFFGRTLGRASHAFVDELALATGLRPVSVDWLNRKRPQFVAHWNFMRMHRVIAAAAFVVTDTYHFTINALNRGVPTVCLHDGTHAEAGGTLGDAKIRILMQQAGMEDMLVDVGQGRPLGPLILDRLAKFDADRQAAALRRIEHQRRGYRSLLEGALRAGSTHRLGAMPTTQPAPAHPPPRLRR